MAEARYELGVMYHNGDSVPKEDARALEWFQKAAGQGLAEAQYTLNDMYYYGLGVARDYTRAAQWARKAAAQDFMETTAAKIQRNGMDRKTERGR